MAGRATLSLGVPFFVSVPESRGGVWGFRLGVRAKGEIAREKTLKPNLELEFAVLTLN